MDHSEKQTPAQEYIEKCQHPQIQALRPDSENLKNLWIPTAEQLQQLLTQKLPYPDRSRLRPALQRVGNIKFIFVNGQPIMALILIHTVNLLEPMPKVCFYKH